MDYLFVCNSGSDNLSKINLRSFEEEVKIPLYNSHSKVGPHGLCSWKGAIITANSYNSSISIVDAFGSGGIEEFHIGGNCNDVAAFNNDIYITCGESNNIVVFDLESKRIVEEIPGGNLPHSIDINYSLGLMAVTNMENDSVTLLDFNNREVVKHISVGNYPTKTVFSRDNKYIFVCESCLGSDKYGSVNIISTETLCSLGKVQAGRSPIDICCDSDLCYVANFSEGYLSFIYLGEMELVKRAFVGGMPRGIRKKGRFLYVGDNYGNQLIKYDIFKDKKEVIAIGREPIGMTIV